jgi:hypothetical protein
VFHRDYHNPRIYSTNVSYEQEFAPAWSGYVDFIWTKGTNLSRFLNYNRSGPVCCNISTANGGTGNTVAYTGPKPWGPQLDEVMVATSLGHSSYRGLTLGVRKRLSDKYQLEANYVFAKDEDDDSNERDPFTDRSFNFLDPGLRLRAVGPRHPEQVQSVRLLRLPYAINLNVRVQSRSAQPITASPVTNGVDTGRNSLRKDNAYSASTGGSTHTFKTGRCQIMPIWRCSTRSTTRTTSIRCRRRRCSTSTASCGRASAIRGKRSWR